MNHGEDLDEMPWPPYKHRVKRQSSTNAIMTMESMIPGTVPRVVSHCFGIVVLGVWQLFLWLWGMTFS